eukprot:4202621-Prymnesium_polylepis.2
MVRVWWPGWPWANMATQSYRLVTAKPSHSKPDNQCASQYNHATGLFWPSRADMTVSPWLAHGHRTTARGPSVGVDGPWLVWYGDASITAHDGQPKPLQARDMLSELIRASHWLGVVRFGRP